MNSAEAEKFEKIYIEVDKIRALAETVGEGGGVFPTGLAMQCIIDWAVNIQSLISSPEVQSE